MANFKNIKWLLLAITAYALNSCYSFKTAGIPPGMETFYVGEFDNTAPNVVATLSTDFTQKLIDKVRFEGNLSPTEYEPHVEFNGEIIGYNVTSVAPEEGQTTAFNRLDIRIRVEFKNNLDDDPKKGWTNTFSFFEDYESDVNLLDIQDDLIEIITDQIVEDIFNKAFSDW